MNWSNVFRFWPFGQINNVNWSNALCFWPFGQINNKVKQTPNHPPPTMINSWVVISLPWNIRKWSSGSPNPPINPPITLVTPWPPCWARAFPAVKPTPSHSCATQATLATVPPAPPARSATAMLSWRIRALLGARSDTVTCSCNAGYYGNGITFALCKTCPPYSLTLTQCLAKSLVDTVTCACGSNIHSNGSGGLILCQACCCPDPKSVMLMDWTAVCICWRTTASSLRRLARSSPSSSFSSVCCSNYCCWISLSYPKKKKRNVFIKAANSLVAFCVCVSLHIWKR